MPRLIGKDVNSAVEVAPLLAAIRGHQMAKAGVENAIWDAEAQSKGVPLAKLLSGTFDEIACGVSLGIQENPQALVRKVEQELGSGYQRIKLKIKPGKDIDFVAAVRKEFPHIRLSVDANSAYPAGKVRNECVRPGWFYSGLSEFVFPDLPAGVYQRDRNSCSLRRSTERERWGWSCAQATSNPLIAETTAT